MKQEITSHQFTDANGNPTGGHAYGVGICIAWQNGPLGRDKGREEPNGAFVEGVIAAVIDRLEFFQRSKFKSTYNAEAIEHLNAALGHLEARTTDREKRKVEGTHAV